MRWTFSIALILLLFSSCTSSKQLKKYIEPNVKMMLEGEKPRLQVNILVQLDSSVVVPDSIIDTKTTKKWFLPLILVYMERIKIRADMSPVIMTSRFSWHLNRNAGIFNLHNILAGDTLRVTVKSIPCRFIYDEYFAAVAGPFNSVGTEDHHKVNQIGQGIQFEYQWGTFRDTVLTGEYKMYLDMNEVSGFSPADAIYKFFNNWDNSLNQMSIKFLKQLLMDYDAKKK